MATTATLIGRVRYATGQASQQAFTDDAIVGHLNRAQEFLLWTLMVGAMPEMTETVTGSLSSSRVALPADFAYEQAVEVGSTLVTARPIAITELDAVDNSRIPQWAASLEQPWYYIWKNATDGAVRLHILVGDDDADDAYALRYVKKPAELAATGSDPVWNERACDLLVEFAAMRVNENIGNHAEKRRRMQNITNRIALINSRFVREGTRHEVRPAWG